MKSVAVVPPQPPPPPLSSPHPRVASPPPSCHRRRPLPQPLPIPPRMCCLPLSMQGGAWGGRGITVGVGGTCPTNSPAPTTCRPTPTHPHRPACIRSRPATATPPPTPTINHPSTRTPLTTPRPIHTPAMDRELCMAASTGMVEGDRAPGTTAKGLPPAPLTTLHPTSYSSARTHLPLPLQARPCPRRHPPPTLAPTPPPTSPPPRRFCPTE